MIFSRQNLDAYCGRAILWLVLAMLVFAPLAFGAVDEWAFLVVQGTGAAIFLIWGARLWLNPKPKLLWPPLTWMVVTFAIYAVARYLTADIEIVARAEVIQVVLFALVFLVILSNLHSQRDAQIISFTLIVLATLISGYAVAQMVTHSDRVWNVYADYHGRAGGTYISPNHLAGLLGMVLPLALAYLLAGRVGIVTRILLAYAMVAMLAGLSATFSRAGWVATGMGILFVLGMFIMPPEPPLAGAADPDGVASRRRDLRRQIPVENDSVPAAGRKNGCERPRGIGLRDSFCPLASGLANVGGSFLVWRGAGPFRLSVSGVSPGNHPGTTQPVTQRLY